MQSEDILDNNSSVMCLVNAMKLEESEKERDKIENSVRLERWMQTTLNWWLLLNHYHTSEKEKWRLQCKIWNIIIVKNSAISDN